MSVYATQSPTGYFAEIQRIDPSTGASVQQTVSTNAGQGGAGRIVRAGVNSELDTPS
ncbi:hypothetical protein [Streptacidiphilus sp. EB129]|uniref:hypothetical protein n=1 Tax=Streptacidiphilus sp. EB129 TaxID=3156262 RepID=UPI0035165B7A